MGQPREPDPTKRIIQRYLKSLTNGRGAKVLKPQIDLRDRLEWERFANDSVRSFGYRDCDRPTTHTDRAGNVFDLSHDDGGRLISIEATPAAGLENGTNQRSFAYDAQRRKS